MTSSAYRDTSDSDSRGLSDLQVNMFKGLNTVPFFALQKQVTYIIALLNCCGIMGIFLNIHIKEVIWVIL